MTWRRRLADLVDQVWTHSRTPLEMYVDTDGIDLPPGPFSEIPAPEVNGMPSPLVD